MSSSPETDTVHGLRALFGAGRDAASQRQAVAEFLLANRDLIRSIARQKLSRAARSVFDSEDVFSSVLRRLDLLVHRRGLVLDSEDAFWGLIAVVARNTAISKTQLIEQMRIRLTEDGPYAYEFLKRLNACKDDDDAAVLVYRMMLSLPSGTDRQILALRQKGSSHAAIAAAMKTTEQAMRQRWKRISDELAARFKGGELDG